MTAEFRDLPSVNALLSDQRVQRLVSEYAHDPVVDLIRLRLEEARTSIRDGVSAPALDDLVADVVRRAGSQWRPWPEQVINATGVVLHTNLGRAPLSRQALDAVVRSASGYSDVEMDLASGRRGSRQTHVEPLLCQLTGAPAAMVVNNNASALLLGLSAVASGKEVIVSRGEAIEIGGGFRIPDVLGQSGATLVEVGTTNRTYVRDFEAAINESTGAILSAHASNFRVTGFTASPALRDLVELGARHGVPVLHDVGSGCLLDTADFGLAHEPMPQESIAAGASLAFFSGDKLLGGPQAGIIVGSAVLMERLLRHPLARAVRIDKLGLAALTATLLHYLRGEAAREVPVWRMIAEPPESLEARANRWRAALGRRSSVVAGQSTIGGGSLPGEVLPTHLVALAPLDGADALGARLRRARPPVVARIVDERVLLDPRTVLPEQDDDLLRVVTEATGE